MPLHWNATLQVCIRLADDKKHEQRVTFFFVTCGDYILNLQHATFASHALKF